MICKGFIQLVSIFLLMSTFSISALYSNIVINEVCYDPIGSDDYHEWIEFYNNGSTNENMENWLLYTGGSELTLTYIFSNFILRPQHYLLLAEEDCSDAHLFANITLQNGGSETDGIRLVSPDSTYTDTILYDSPNSNFLPDDVHDTGTVLCPDIGEGHSLARVQNGVDTNTAGDWFDCITPTPGSANIIPVDLALGITSVDIQDFDVKLHTSIHNLSTTNVYNSHEFLEIRLNNFIYASLIIPEITALDSAVIDTTIHCTETGTHNISLFLDIIHDTNPVDNLWITSFFLGEIPLIFNEILYSPSPDNQEWIEIYNRGNSDLTIQNLHLKDAANNEIVFDITIPIQSYKVLCTDSLDFVHNYPNCPTSAVIKLNHWVTLNNDEEIIWLIDDTGNTLDSLHYRGSSLAYDKSLERRNPITENADWDICQIPAGGTPGQENSNFALVNNAYFNSVQLHVEGDALIHQVHMQSDEQVENIHLSCFQHDNASGLGELKFDQYISLPEDSVCVFTQAKPGVGYHAFQYKLECEGDTLSSEYWSYYNNNYLPFVVNEIMYDPLTGYPEWLEIRRNVDLLNYPLVTIHISADSVFWQPDDSQFTVITEDGQDAESLCEQYQCIPERFVYDLPSLNNTGESIYFADAFGNRWEEFAFNPDWSPDKGISIERIQPQLLPGRDNWSPCLTANGGTPGQENSIYTQQIPSSTNISIKPNPFFPKKAEICEIHYSFPRALSRVSCKIYDLKGRQVRILADQSLVSAEGAFLWDGKNESAKALPIGVYLVYFEAYDKDQKHAFHKQNTVVLGN